MSTVRRVMEPSSLRCTASALCSDLTWRDGEVIIPTLGEMGRIVGVRYPDPRVVDASLSHWAYTKRLLGIFPGGNW